MVSKRQIVISLLFIAGLLASCTGASSPSATPENVATLTDTSPAQTAAVSTPTHEPGCTVQTRQPTPNATVESLLPAVTDEDWTQGPANALVTILEYSDFQ